MKITTGSLFKAAALTLAFAASSANNRLHAQLTVLAPGYGVQNYYTHTTGDGIISYDWDSSSNLYYMTSAGFPDTSVWKTSGGAPTSIYANPSNFAGASVVAIGNYVYFNDSTTSNTQLIHRYGPVSGSPALAQTTAANSNFTAGPNGGLFIAGSENFGPNNIYYTALGADGSLTSNPPVSLGITGGFSGPISFDLEGNLYYAPGFSDTSIYKWTAAEIAAAIANPSANPLSFTSHLWLNYGSLYSTVAGATSMLIDADGDLLVTLTSFSDPSVLVEFGANAGGAFDGSNLTILNSTGRLGELRAHAGNVYLSTDNKIVAVVPEPNSLLLALAGGSALVLWRGRRARVIA